MCTLYRVLLGGQPFFLAKHLMWVCCQAKKNKETPGFAKFFEPHYPIVGIKDKGLFCSIL